MSQRFDEHVANAILGIDTLWGGDVMNPSGLGRFIADSWFSDVPMPLAYTHPSAARVRESGGVSAKEPDRAAIETYLAAVDVHGAIAALGAEAKSMSGLRGRYVAGLALSFEVMWDMAMEILGKGEPVPYERSVLASTGLPPSPSDPAAKRRQVKDLLARAGYPSASDGTCSSAVDAWRGARYVPMACVRSVGGAYIAHYRALAERNLRPFLPREMGDVPMDNIEFLPIKDSLVLGLDELPRAQAPPRRPAGVRGHLRDQRLAGDLRSRVLAVGQPRSGSRPRDHVRLPAEPVRARRGRVRSVGADHEHARGSACRRHREQRDPDGARRDRDRRELPDAT